MKLRFCLKLRITDCSLSSLSLLGGEQQHPKREKGTPGTRARLLPFNYYTRLCFIKGLTLLMDILTTSTGMSNLLKHASGSERVGQKFWGREKWTRTAFDSDIHAKA